LRLVCALIRSRRIDCWCCSFPPLLLPLRLPLLLVPLVVIAATPTVVRLLLRCVSVSCSLLLLGTAFL